MTTEPTFFYCCKYDSNKLHRYNLLTGKKSCHEVPNYRFKTYSRWSEVPGGSLLITEGDVSMDVVKIDTHREYAVSSQPPMHTAREDHAAVYLFQYLYVLGGYERRRCLSECERYSCAESRWEVLPALPLAAQAMNAVEVENNLYALGGYDHEGDLDTVQKLSLDSLTWQLMQLKLPQADFRFPCFKTDTQVYLVIDDTLFSFTPLQVKAVKNVRKIGPKSIKCYSSYYSRGTLYYDNGRDIRRLALRN
jgi:hypothetical protein